MPVGGWLRGLGLGAYEGRFRDSKINVDVVADLTDRDLEKLGLPLRDRKRLLRGIATLASREQPPTEARLATPASPRKSSIRADSAERRPVTIMFCDLVGSTSIAAKLDAEDWRNLVSPYLDEASAAIANLGGYVLKRLGDGLMAVFGYPQAQENDAERAVRAALAIQRALAEINARNAGKGAQELTARVGIELGPVVVDATGEVFGDAPNVAARVQAAAEPGSVLVTINVQRHVAGLFVAEEQGARKLRGVLEPVQLYRIVRASGTDRRGRARAPTPFVGREDNLALLMHCWERVRGSDGQFIQIVGEPGLGKSRLVEEFRARLGETPHTWVEWSSSQLLQNTPLHPITETGRARFGRPEVPPEARFADLESALAQVKLEVQETAALLALLFDIPLPAGRAPNLPPEELRRRQLAAMVAWTLAGARSQPVVLAFEDLHWADPTTLDLMQALAERGGQAPLLILATARPEFRPPWNLRSHHSLISLSPLDRAEVAQMVSGLAARHALCKEVVERVSERTGGVPLFVEEVTRLLLERGSEAGGLQAIPPTLQQSLAARLDRMGEAREAAQIGAVLGRSFSYALLRDVAGLAETNLQTSLKRLADASLLFVEGAPPLATYRFKHALIKDAAYESLLKSRRKPLHRRAAEILREIGAEPEAIAHHFTEAGLDDLAIEWWTKAGDLALRRSAFSEAIADLGHAIEMADNVDKDRSPLRFPSKNDDIAGLAAWRDRRPRVQVAYGNTLCAARGFGTSETTEAFANARGSSMSEQDWPDRLAADFGLWVGSYTRGELPQMREHAAAFLADVKTRPDSPEAGVAHRAQGITHWFAGEFFEARDHLERALALFEPGRDVDLAYRFGMDPGVPAMAYLGFTLWFLGEIDPAASLVERARARVATLTHTNTRALGTVHAVMFELMRGDRSQALTDVSDLTRILREYDLRLFRALDVFLEGWATTESGALAAGLEGMRRGADSLREQNALVFDGLIKLALADVEVRADGLDRALVILDEALAVAERTGFRAFDAELHRARGGVFLKRDPSNPAPAEEAFQTAIAVARKQGARSFELRAAFSLAKLYQSTGRLADAHAVLARAIDGFAPTPEMPVIAEAQALLAALAETDQVKADEAWRQRRLHLQTAYGQAVMWSKGFAAEETKVAFARAADLAAKSDDFLDRFAAAHGQWTSTLVSGDLKSAQELASAFLWKAEDAGYVTEAGVARRGLALISYLLGDFAEARTHCERALAACNRRHEEEARERHGEYTGTIATAILAATNWQLGEVDQARKFIDLANRRAAELGHPPSMGAPLFERCQIEIYRGDPAAALSAAKALEVLGREHGMMLFRLRGKLVIAWALGRLHDAAAGAAEFRQVLTALADQGQMIGAPFFYAFLAELEAQAFGAERALASIDQGLALARQLDQRAGLAFLHRLRGEILLKRDPDSAAPAEDALQTAIAVARLQGARSLGLQAALPLAKFYQSTGRPVEAHIVLTPALKGFSPTPEMPEIAQAQALMESLA